MAQEHTITLDTVMKRNEEILSYEVDEETMMMSVETGNYYSMEAIGTRIWQLLEQPTPLSDICDILVREFEVTRGQCEADVIPFLTELAKDGLIHITSIGSN